MPKFVLLILLSLLSVTARAATIELCATYDDDNKYFVADTASRSSVESQVIARCTAHHENPASCRAHVICETLLNRKPTRLAKTRPFPPALQGHPPVAGHPHGGSSNPFTPEPEPTPRDTSAGGSCHANSDCFSQQYCAGGTCFARSGDGGGSCKSNNDCFSQDFCVSGQCFPRTGNGGGSCHENSDCFSQEFCVSGQCFPR